jgi:hypothetical protein
MIPQRFTIFTKDNRAGYYWVRYVSGTWPIKMMVYWHGSHFNVMGLKWEHIDWASDSPPQIFGPLKAPEECDGFDFMQRDM